MPCTFGIKQQMERIIKSTFTPASEARYKAAINCGSLSALTLMIIRAFLPAWAYAIS